MKDTQLSISRTSVYATFIVFLNLFVIVLSLSSLLLCLRALLRAQLLKHETMIFMSRHYNWVFTVQERCEFLNLWYVMICTNDCLIILGSVIKQLIESRSIVGDMWDMCSLMLGTGSCLVWFGILRYLGFFKTYNVLILTMKGAAPNMFRFLICAFFLYVGFTFAGWVILGPYHFKFKTIMSTSECLFSLINGDDMFATFSSIPETSFSVWVYSRFGDVTLETEHFKCSFYSGSTSTHSFAFSSMLFFHCSFPLSWILMRLSRIIIPTDSLQQGKSAQEYGWKQTS